MTDLWQRLLSLNFSGWSITPLTLACAMIAAVGVALFSLSIGIPALSLNRVLAIFLRLMGRSVQLGVVEHETEQSRTAFERAIAPLTDVLRERSSADERAWVETAYDQLGRQHTPASYYTKKVIGGFVGFGLGMVWAVLLTTMLLLWPLLVFPLVCSLIGYVLPTWQLRTDLAQRREQMLFEIPAALDMLSVNILFKKNIAQGLIETVRMPEGGYVMRELLQVALDYQKTKRLVEAFHHMAARNADVPALVRIAQRLAMAESTGAPVTAALQAAADRATRTLHNLIQQRGTQNNALIAAPSMLAVLGVLIAVAGPQVAALMQFFGR